MFGKLLKYDLRAIFKYWWIAAFSSLGLSIVGGTSMKVFLSLAIKSELEDIEPWLTIFSFLGMLLSFVGLSAFLLASEIFIYVRLYKHLFSDEGYLTFTLPVKRRDILNSKLISGLIVNASTFAVILVDLAILLLIAIDTTELSNALSFWAMFAKSAFKELGAVSILYISEAIIALLCLATASYLLIALCITFAAIIAKKYKIFAAIGIYYVVNAAASFASQIAMMLGSVMLADIFSQIPQDAIPLVLSLIILVLLLICCAVTAFMYWLEHYLLNKKLELT